MIEFGCFLRFLNSHIFYLCICIKGMYFCEIWSIVVRKGVPFRTVPLNSRGSSSCPPRPGASPEDYAKDRPGEM